jgi:hypothetical protein
MKLDTKLVGSGTRLDPYIPEAVVDLNLKSWGFGNDELTITDEVEASRVKDSPKWKSKVKTNTGS